jgi:hypothetical protein
MLHRSVLSPVTIRNILIHEIRYIMHISTVKPLLTDLYGENHGADKPVSQMSEGKGNVVIDMKK